MGKVIAVINQKGGVGKTTTVINLGAALGARGFRVLLVDVDPQGNSTQGLGVDKSKVKKSTYHALIDGVRGDEIRIHTQFENLDLMPATNARTSLATCQTVRLRSRRSTSWTLMRPS